MRFGKTKGEIRVKKGVIWVIWEGFDGLDWESAIPKRKTFLLLPLVDQETYIL